ncbi:MAG: aminotransferase class I/II-fold pyridoxal phosphate-dependent enzyme, partial [Desulfarculaceae bacterium]|nr:aminotransferase class I/II-fold pyridoxal phosphate-dependent enzyme [Desulfarculaceae bacterium]
MNPIADELNQTIESANPHVYEMLSDMGKTLFFPKGILSQSAEAKQKAHRINATIGIAKQAGQVMGLESITSKIKDLPPDEYLPYAPSFGKPELRERWKQEIQRKNPALQGKDISLPVVTCGVTHSISTFADVWIDPGDPVLLPDMMWGNYNMSLNVRKGADIQHYQTFNPELSALDLDSLEKSVREFSAVHQKIVLIFNFPHNPSGYSATQAEAARIIDILTRAADKGTNIIAACDDAYFGLFYENEAMKESLFAKLSGIHKRILAVKLDGATKEDFVWGFRVGFITYAITGEHGAEAAHQALEKKTAGAIRGAVSNASHLSQSLLLQAMKSDTYSKEKEEKFQILKSRALKVKAVLQQVRFQEAWDVYPFNSGYFMCIRLKETDAEELRVHLL